MTTFELDCEMEYLEFTLRNCRLNIKSIERILRFPSAHKRKTLTAAKANLNVEVKVLRKIEKALSELTIIKNGETK